jgi:hypothetical protein
VPLICHGMLLVLSQVSYFYAGTLPTISVIFIRVSTISKECFRKGFYSRVAVALVARPEPKGRYACGLPHPGAQNDGHNHVYRNILLHCTKWRCNQAIVTKGSDFKQLQRHSSSSPAMA